MQPAVLNGSSKLDPGLMVCCKSRSGMGLTTRSRAAQSRARCIISTCFSPRTVTSPTIRWQR
eukprot:SAG11_NODE_511_length_8847_cov_3.611911_4_plen_62_part_00